MQRFATAEISLHLSKFAACKESRKGILFFKGKSVAGNVKWEI